VAHEWPPLVSNTRAQYLTAQHTFDGVLLEQRGAELRETRGGEEEHGLGRLPALLLLRNVRQQAGGDDDGTESCT
jgi:hypothetical protein